MIKVSAIEGNRQWLDGGSMFGNAPRAVWATWTEVDELGRIPLACRCLLIETRGLKILCETGIGAFFEPKLAERFGVETPTRHRLLENLKALGHEPDSIDYVILSHLHFDHAGGLLPTYADMEQGQDGLVFPNAQFLVGEDAWARAQNPHFRDKASFVPTLNQRLQDSGRMVIIKDNQPPIALADFIQFFESEGHTPGQMHTIVRGDKQNLVFAGDLIPGKAWVHLPITMGYDRFPERVIEEKQSLYNRWKDSNLELFFTHDPEFAMGELAVDGKGKFSVINLKANPIGLPL